MHAIRFISLIVLILFSDKIFGQTITNKDLIGAWKEVTYNKMEWDFINDSDVNIKFIATGQFETYKYSLKKIDGNQVFQYQLKRDTTSSILISKISKIDNNKLEIGVAIVKYYDFINKKWKQNAMNKSHPAYLVRKN